MVADCVQLSAHADMAPIYADTNIEHMLYSYMLKPTRWGTAGANI